MMLSLTEIERAVDGLTAEQKRELHRYLQEALESPKSARPAANGHSVLDIAAIQLGSVLHPLSLDDDVLGDIARLRREARRLVDRQVLARWRIRDELNARAGIVLEGSGPGAPDEQDEQQCAHHSRM